LGIVYSQTAGNAQGLVEGRLVKRMQPGFASQAGVTSAFLSRAGITGPHGFLSGPYGFYSLYERGEFDPEPVVQALGEHFAIADLSLKPYPCCRMTHASIDAALQIRRDMGEPAGEVEKIQVFVSPMVAEMVGKPFVIGTDPQVDAQFSIPYTVSTALVRGDVFLEDFELHRITDQEVNTLARRVEVSPDHSLGNKDIIRARVRVQVRSGHCYEAQVSAPLGNPANPLDLKRCKEKFRKCLNHSRVGLDEGRAQELLSAIEHLEELEDVRELISLMSC